ncbi:MAG: winged helix-turn-helix domain-containing protein [Caulobacterales bacterium]|jgi:DNA-binding transcriptional ArsR family regulator
MSNPFDHSSIDEAIHGRLRLGIMAYLSSVSPARFLELREAVKATDGNLSAHLSKLEEAGYIRIDKRFEGKRPVTDVGLTDAGRDAWIVYLDRLQRLMNAAKAAE